MADYDLVGSIANFGLMSEGNGPKKINKLFDFYKDFKNTDVTQLAINDTVQLLGLPPHSILIAVNYQVVIPTKTATADIDLGWTADPDGIAALAAADAVSQVTVDNTDLVLQATGTKLLMTVKTAAITPPFRLFLQAVVMNFDTYHDEVIYGN